MFKCYLDKVIFIMINDDEIIKACKALGHKLRLKIFKFIVKNNLHGSCPSDILSEIETTNANISFHLKELENANLLYKKKLGKHIFYYANMDYTNSIMQNIIKDCCSN